jgi:phosphodiesterase/alkaline phosphatase D-like protein
MTLLGRVQVQRAWLQDTIAASEAPIVLVVSGSVVFGAPSRVNRPTDDPPYTGYCSGDDLDCYRPAQQNLIATLSTARGCVIILTGDYHAADIKRLDPVEAALYTDAYLSNASPHPCACSACCTKSTANLILHISNMTGMLERRPQLT